MNVLRQNGARCVENGKEFEGILSQTFQSKKKASKIKEAIKSFIIESIKTIGKTLTTAIITTVIVKATKLLEIANADRPQFAIGGEWILIILIFCFVYWLIENFEQKNKKATHK